jgi:hypothetical protein
VAAVISALLGVAVIAGIVALIWFAPQIPALSKLTTSPEQRTERVSQSLEGLEEASVDIDVGRGRFELDALRESASLIEADVSHYGVLQFDVNKRGDRADVKLDVRRPNPLTWLPGNEERWDVGLSSDVLYDLNLDFGSGTHDVDLGDLLVTDFRVDQGSGHTTLTLPSSGKVEASLDLGSGGLDITLPGSMEAQVELDKGSGDFRPGPRFKLERGRESGDSTWETDNFDGAADRISIEIDMGSGDITIR